MARMPDGWVVLVENDGKNTWVSGTHELVLCKNCRFAKVENDYGLDEVTCYNEEFGPHCLVPLDWFCAAGERRESE